VRLFMDNEPALERDFNQAAARKISERERLLRELSTADQERVSAIRLQHERDVLERRQLQGAHRAEDIRKERERLLREHPQPALRPNTRPPARVGASQIERAAAALVDEQNAREVAAMGSERDVEIDKFLLEKGKSYEQFNDEREQLDKQRMAIKNNNDLTRQL
jgi:hypothetical protein